MDEAEAVLGGKWFWPILCQIDALEAKLLEVMPILRPVLADDSADWTFRSLQDIVRMDGDVNGFCDARKMGARDVGRIVGAKFSLCEAMAKSKAKWDSVTPEQVATLEVAMKYPGYVAECREIARMFADELTPEMVRIERYAIELAILAGSPEKIDYLAGYVQGAGFMDRVRSKLKPARTKRAKDAGKRAIVLLFAALIGEAIDQEKSDLSWPELHRIFREVFNHQVDIDEETFKKILSRKGLKGVGKVGRPVPMEKLPVKRSRRNTGTEAE